MRYHQYYAIKKYIYSPLPGLGIIAFGQHVHRLGYFKRMTNIAVKSMSIFIWWWRLLCPPHFMEGVVRIPLLVGLHSFVRLEGDSVPPFPFQMYASPPLSPTSISSTAIFAACAIIDHCLQHCTLATSTTNSTWRCRCCCRLLKKMVVSEEKHRKRMMVESRKMPKNEQKV